MQKFSQISSIIAPLKLDNVDTDMLIPKQFLKTIKRTGLGKNLFHEMRFDLEGNEIKDFILNTEPFNKSNILISGKNFGCGSSREHAPWALIDFGIRVVIAPSFADIFFNNCFKNSILPIILPEEKINQIWQIIAEQKTVQAAVDLPSQTITIGEKKISFAVESFRKKCLIEGLDDIALTLEKQQEIDSYEEKAKNNTPWLFASEA